MNVVFSAEAANDLTRIADYVAQNSPDRAITFARKLIHATETLPTRRSAFPLFLDMHMPESAAEYSRPI